MKMVCWVLSADEKEATADKGDDGPETRQTETNFRGNICNSNLGTVVYTCNLGTTKAKAEDCKFKGSLSLRYSEFRPARLTV